MSTIPAVFDQGVFRPLEPIDPPAGTQATVMFNPPAASKPWADLFGTLPDEDVRQMMEAIEEAFEQVEMQNDVGEGRITCRILDAPSCE